MNPKNITICSLLTIALITLSASFEPSGAEVFQIIDIIQSLAYFIKVNAKNGS